MVRVKIISEMEGPYQATLSKKEAELAEVHSRLAVVERKLSLTSLELEESRLSKQQETDDLKLFYEGEVARLNSKLDCLAMGSDARDKDRLVLRKLRKDLEEARTITQIKEDEAEELRREKDLLREEKNQLLIRLSSRHGAENSDKVLGQVEQLRLTEQLKTRSGELEALTRELSKERDDRRKLQRSLEELVADKDQARDELARVQLKVQDCEDRIRRVSEERDEVKLQIRRVQHSYEETQVRLIEKEKEIVSIREKHKGNQKGNGSELEYDYNERMEEFSSRQGKWERVEADYKQTIEDLRREIKQLKDSQSERRDIGR